MSDEKTIRVRARCVNNLVQFSSPHTGDNFLDYFQKDLPNEKDSHEYDITIRRVPKTKRRQWIFTETGEVRRPQKDEFYAPYLHGVAKSSCDWPPGSAEYPILRLEEREVEA